MKMHQKRYMGLKAYLCLPILSVEVLLSIGLSIFKYLWPYERNVVDKKVILATTKCFVNLKVCWQLKTVFVKSKVFWQLKEGWQLKSVLSTQMCFCLLTSVFANSKVFLAAQKCFCQLKSVSSPEVFWQLNTFCQVFLKTKVFFLQLKSVFV